MISNPLARRCPEVLTMWLANEALRRVKGSDVALLAASEPLWAAVAAVIFLGDARDLVVALREKDDSGGGDGDNFRDGNNPRQTFCNYVLFYIFYDQ